MSTPQIHPQAVVAAGAKLGAGVSVGAYAIIGDGVELGEGCVLHAHAMVQGPSKIGRDNVFYPFCVVGGDPQDLRFRGERTELARSEEHTSELQSHSDLVCRLLLEKKKKKKTTYIP